MSMRSNWEDTRWVDNTWEQNAFFGLGQKPNEINEKKKWGTDFLSSSIFRFFTDIFSIYKCIIINNQIIARGWGIRTVTCTFPKKMIICFFAANFNFCLWIFLMMMMIAKILSRVVVLCNLPILICFIHFSLCWLWKRYRRKSWSE